MMRSVALLLPFFEFLKGYIGLNGANGRFLQKSFGKISRGASLKWYNKRNATEEPSSLQTRPSLLNRLKTGDDTASWQEFYRLYGKLVSQGMARGRCGEGAGR